MGKTTHFLRQFSLRFLFVAVLIVAVIAAFSRPRPSQFLESIDAEYLATLYDTDAAHSRRIEPKKLMLGPTLGTARCR